MPRATRRGAALVLLLACPAAAQEPSREVPGRAAHQRILDSIESPDLRRLLAETVVRNPAILAAEARARAARLEAPQARALPDPVAAVTAFLASPETRTGPQRLAVSVTQALPWLTRLARRERAAILEAAALEAEAEAERLRALTEARRLFHEIGFLDHEREIVADFRSHLLQHEEIARARYSTGVGGGQGVIKLQAEITRVDHRLLDLDARRVSLVARLNALRDRPSSLPLFPLAPAAVTVPVEVELRRDELVAVALRSRPELVAAEARRERSETLRQLAELGFRPDFRVGLTYTLVEPRQDAPGRLLPPAGNGDDIFGLQGALTLPIRRGKLEAALAESVERVSVAEHERRGAVAAVESVIGDLAERIPLIWRRLRLIEDQLTVQAEESLQSAQAGYIAGALNALDLLDAEHVLFEARTASARAATDYQVGLARLEGAIGDSVIAHTPREASK